MSKELIAAIEVLKNLLGDIRALKTRSDRNVGLDRVESWFSVIRAQRFIDENA